ncbi:TonB-dependent receptor [Zobellia nedashkovskayae]|uniref:TonB-dependent receptor n=1 Tax=Zobellia nedashkovskayae TaxID=2779510 RepID=UPI00188A9C73|nr:TonB-dependent receptor [Zobellia nedashkovskayae]
MHKTKISFKWRLLTFLGVLSFFYIGSSQEINGHVLNVKGFPIIGATVKTSPNTKYTTTDSEGYFQIHIQPNDSILFLNIKHLAHAPVQITLSELKTSSSMTITMPDAVTNLDEVTVVQSRILQRAVNQSQSIVVIDQDFISKNNTGTFAGALASIPGINTMNVGVAIAKPIIRGMGFNRILVNNRGIKQEGQQWGADHGLEIDPFDIENVEIIKGPASLLYGSDGMGGVINITEGTRLAENGNHIELSSSYQTNNGAISNSLEWKGKHNNWFYSARSTYQDYGDYTVPSDEFTYAGFNLPIYDNRLKNTAGKELHFSGAIGYGSENFESSLRLSSFNQKAGIFTGAIGLPRAYNLQHNGEFRDIDVPRQENSHHAITSNTTLNFGPHSLELDLGYQRNNREELSFPGAHGISPEQVDSNLALGLYLDTYTANLRFGLNPNPNHQLMFGMQLQHMRNNKDGFEYLLPVFKSFQLGLYHYQSIDISNNWMTNFGVRYDIGSHDIERHLQPIYDPGTLLPTGEFTERTPEFERSFDNISASAGLSYKANSQNHIKLNLGNSFRFPTAIELSSNGVHHGNFRHELGDPNLGVERGYQADVTYLHQSKSLFLEVAAFYGYYTDYIYLSPTGNFSPLASGGTLWEYRQDNAIFNGFEITAGYELPFQLHADLALDFVQNLNLNSNLGLPLTPQPAVVGKLEYDFTGFKRVKNASFFLSGRYNFQQNRTDRNERETPDSFILDMGIAFDVIIANQKIKCNLGANNLLNTAYFNHISRYRLLNLPEQGRNFIFTVNVPISL